MRDCDPFSARHWIVSHLYIARSCKHYSQSTSHHCVICCQVRNTRTVNRTGQLTGYKLVPGSNCLPLARPEAKFLRRAAFLKHNLWVTRYAPDEKFPGGEFPNQNPRAGEGLATWVKQNRSLEESDVVLWYASSFFFFSHNKTTKKSVISMWIVRFTGMSLGSYMFLDLKIGR